jgi:hypothetical protein
MLLEMCFYVFASWYYVVDNKDAKGAIAGRVLRQ